MHGGTTVGRRVAWTFGVALLALTAAVACSDSDSTSSDPTTTAVASQKGAAPAPSGAEAPEAASLSADAGVAEDSDADQNIIGGQTISIAAVPWTAALVRAGVEPASQAQFCGGVLVQPKVILTAAHCVTTPTGAGPITLDEVNDPSSIEVVLGRTDLDESGGERLAVSSVWVSTRADTEFADGHPTAMHGDYALLELAEPSEQTPVALPDFSMSESWAGTVTYDVGWGCTQANTPQGQDCTPQPTNQLQIADLDVQPNATCTARWGTSFTPQFEMCVADAQATQSYCNGDSGGPLIVQGSDNRWYVLGLNSWAIVGCQPGVPAGAAFVPWLMDPTGQSWIDPNELFIVRRPSTG